MQLVLARFALPVGALLALNACIEPAQFARGEAVAKTGCKEGSLGCFCRVKDQTCWPGLMCIDDRCVDPDASKSVPDEPSPEPSEEVQSDLPAGKGNDVQPSEPGEGDPSPESSPSEPGKACTQDQDCEDQNPCTADRCVELFCRHEDLPGAPCDDNDPCTGSDHCQDGACVGLDTRVLNENFSSLPLDWFGRRGTMDDGFVPDPKPSRWQIGAAVPSRCGSKSKPVCGEDPAQDFSPGPDNTLAGVVIGGCHEVEGDWVWDCFFSPFFETDFFDNPPRFSYRRHLHAPGVRLDGRKRGVEHRIVLRSAQDSIETLIQGYEGITNDPSWIEDSASFASRTESTSIGFCYRRSEFSKSFAGWSIDEVRVAQSGCSFEDQAP